MTVVGQLEWQVEDRYRSYLAAGVGRGRVVDEYRKYPKTV
jgi:hypothetical protein